MKAQLLIALALTVGGLLTLQGLVNAQLSKALAHPLQASFISFTVGLLCLAVLMAFNQVRLPAPRVLGEIPWYLYSGGLLGIIYVTTMLVLIPKVGVANVVFAIFVGQMLVSISADHFGWLDNPVRTVDLSRVGGCVLLLAGLYLVQRSG